jgi:two-component system response regulator HydG
MTTSRVLCVDSDASHGDSIRAVLAQLGHVATTTLSPIDALALIASEPFDVVLTHLAMSEMDPMQFCERLIGTQPDVPVVVLTGQASMDAAIHAMRAGAFDFLSKPVDPSLLAICVERATVHRRLRSEVQQLRRVVIEKPKEDSLVGDSPAMMRVRELVARVGDSDASVLICGESGSGKELVARALHHAGPRKAGPFVAINCAAVSTSLLESELFGHVKGAFTDARTARRGLFVEATGGTLFLDEVGDMAVEMQARLLRALQERRVRPVGSDREVPFDARVISATHRDLEEEQSAGRFRQDLYYRLNVVRIDVPPLRARRSDVLKLAERFLAVATARSAKPGISISPQVAERLIDYEWPGNVRELENCIEGAVALARLTHMTVEDLPAKIRGYRPDRFVLSADDEDEIVSLETVERRYITRVIKVLGGNKARAAELLGLDRWTLYRKLDRYEATA